MLRQNKKNPFSFIHFSWSSKQHRVQRSIKECVMTYIYRSTGLPKPSSAAPSITKFRQEQKFQNTLTPISVPQKFIKFSYSKTQLFPSHYVLYQAARDNSPNVIKPADNYTYHRV